MSCVTQPRPEEGQRWKDTAEEEEEEPVNHRSRVVRASIPSTSERAEAEQEARVRVALVVAGRQQNAFSPCLLAQVQLLPGAVPVQCLVP
jgi:hypothetical protein